MRATILAMVVLSAFMVGWFTRPTAIPSATQANPLATQVSRLVTGSQIVGSIDTLESDGKLTHFTCYVTQ